MRCISLWQPWASVIFERDHDGIQVKPDETRHWATAVRGRIAIHAAKKVLRYDEQAYYEPQMLALGLRWSNLPFGCIIGTANLVQCLPTTIARRNRELWQQFWGDYSDDRYAWELCDPVKLETPVPWKGKQGFFDVPDSILQFN